MQQKQEMKGLTKTSIKLKQGMKGLHCTMYFTFTFQKIYYYKNC